MYRSRTTEITEIGRVGNYRGARFNNAGICHLDTATQRHSDSASKAFNCRVSACPRVRRSTTWVFNDRSAFCNHLQLATFDRRVGYLWVSRQLQLQRDTRQGSRRQMGAFDLTRGDWQRVPAPRVISYYKHKRNSRLTQWHWHGTMQFRLFIHWNLFCPNCLIDNKGGLVFGQRSTDNVYRLTVFIFNFYSN